jgi:hypothetical protein
VECYAGRKGEERPIRFRLDERKYAVEDVVDSWYGPEHVFFKVRADDGGRVGIRALPRDEAISKERGRCSFAAR